MIGEFLIEDFKFTLKFSHELLVDDRKRMNMVTCNVAACDPDNDLAFTKHYICKDKSLDSLTAMFKRIKYAIDNKQVKLAFNDYLKNELMLTLTWGSDRGAPSVYQFVLKNKAKNTMIAIREKEIKTLKRKYDELAESVGLINKAISDVKNDELEPGEIVEHDTAAVEHN